AIERPLTDSDLERTLAEVTTAFLDMKRRRLAREVADHDGETPFVRPRRVDPHPRERGAVPVGREARCEPQILERAVATIAEEEVRHGIVRDEDVGKPIAVDILDDDTERLAAKPGDAGELGDVLESPVALASKQKRRLRRKHGDGAILLRPRSEGAVDAFFVSRRPLDVATKKKIQVTVEVVIEEGRGPHPAASPVEAGIRRSIAEATILVLEKAHAVKAIEEKVRITVLVQIGGRESHPIEG